MIRYVQSIALATTLIIVSLPAFANAPGGSNPAPKGTAVSMHPSNSFIQTTVCFLGRNLGEENEWASKY